MRPKLPQFFIPFILLLAACQSDEPDLGFYFWRSGSGISDYELQRLESTGSNVLYLRITDLVWDQNSSSIEATGLIPSFPEVPESIEIIPVVYIQHQCFIQNIEANQLSEMLCATLEQYQGFDRVNEIQIDCDWTKSSKEKYFEFLKALKLESGKDLSVTIRLHQTKYPEQTGVPPADRGMLMFYNMSNLNDPEIENFIFHPETAQAYLVDFSSYPIPLDVALAIYSQGVLIRNNRPIDLLPAIDAQKIEVSGKFELEDENRYRCVKEGYFEGRYLNEGDLLRLELIDSEILFQAADMLANHFGRSPGRVVFYNLDAFHLNRFTDENFRYVLNLFY